jgi:hypothetical protein
MASAFLSQALREQATQEARGQMMKDAIARRVSSQIMGQLAQGEVNADLRRVMGKGRALEQAAGQEMRREIGKTQLEMQKEQAAKAKKMALVGAAADSVGALISMLAEDDEEKEKAAQTRMRDSSPVFTDAERASVIEDSLMYGGATGGNVISQLQAQDDALMYGGTSGGDLMQQLEGANLDAGEYVAAPHQVGALSPEEELAELIREKEKKKRWMADLPPMPNQAGGM